MRLSKMYCKEIIKEMDKIPVFLPGTPVAVGDIITFGKGFIKPRPIGSFDPVSKLSNLGISFVVEDDADPDPYLFASKGAVGVKFTAGSEIGTVGKGKLEINFKKEGATYFASVGCTVKSMSDVAILEEKLEPHKNKLDWKNCFIVTSVTTAKKALIMQSNSSSASLSIEGDVKGLQTKGDTDVSASANVHINSYEDSAFIKDWSDNVTVFFTLARYKKKFFGSWGLKLKAELYHNKENDTYQLSPVDIDDFIFDDE